METVLSSVELTPAPSPLVEVNLPAVDAEAPAASAEPLTDATQVSTKAATSPLTSGSWWTQVLFWLSVCFCLACCGKYVWKSNRPRVIVRPAARFEFGAVPAGSQLTHRFELYNPGWQALRIHALKKSCGCLSTALSVSDNLIAPRSTATLDVGVNLAGSAGTRTVIVTLETSDESQPQLTLEITGQVTPLPTDQESATSPTRAR